MSHYAKPEVSTLNQLTGKPFPPPTDYSRGNLSPDLAIVMCRKPLTYQDAYQIAFGTSPKVKP